MDWIFHEIKQRSLVSPTEQAYHLPQSPPQNLQSHSFNLENKVSPSILLVTVIIAIIFFVSGSLHLLVRFLLRLPNGEQPEDLDNNVTAIQGQLQQLFHLHDAGVDQSLIDALPVFHYKSIIGVKNPLDCAVCLCEFEPEDRLRLLPKCSHSFHVECIDTWLLSHSTCPLCRASLLPDFSAINGCSSMVLVLESGIESSREIVSTDREGVLGRSSSVLRSNSYLGLCGDTELGSSQPISCEILEKDELKPIVIADSGEKVVPVKLGKFRNVDGGEGSSNNNSDDARRCFSMESFEYVMDENSFLKVSIRTPSKKPLSSKKTCSPFTPGHRLAMSECDCESRRGFNGFEITRNFESNGSCSSTSDNNGNGTFGQSKKESFSMSKIWLRGKKDKQNFAEDSSRRAFSFRFPQQHPNVAATAASAVDGSFKVKNGIAGARDAIKLGCDEENQSCFSLDSQAKTPSFARTLLWVAGRQNKVVHSSFTPKV